MSNKKIVVCGVEYPSISDACRHYNISIDTVSHRIRNSGWSVDQAFTTPVLRRVEKNVPITKIKNNKIIAMKGVKYESVSEACKVFGISSSVVYQRLAKGWSLEDALTLDRKVNSKSITVNGITYKSKSEACRQLGMHEATVTSRLRQGSSVDEAFSKNLKKEKKSIVVHGVEYSSISEACRKLGLSRNKVRGRLKRGYSVDEAFSEGTVYGVTVNGVVYKSLQDACDSFGVSLGLVNARKAKGFSLESALGILPPECNGVINQIIWNKHVKEIYISKVINDGEYYRCFVGNNVRYYSKEELIIKWEKFKGIIQSHEDK